MQTGTKALGDEVVVQSSVHLFHAVSSQLAIVLVETAALKDSALAHRGPGISRLLAGLAGNVGAILKIATHAAWVDECYMLARTMVERCINAAYLSVCGDEEYRLYLQYEIAARARSENRSISLAGRSIEIKRAGTVQRSPEVIAAVARFTSKRGRALNWTQLTLEQRASEVAKCEPMVSDVFGLAILSVYSRASEALHGTMFGMNDFPDPIWLQEGTPVLGEAAVEAFDWSGRNQMLASLMITMACFVRTFLGVLANRGQHVAISQANTNAVQMVDSFFGWLRSPSTA